MSFTQLKSFTYVDPQPLRKTPSPIPCRGYEINTPDAHDFDCAYDHPPACEDCVVNAGRIDPRTGKRYRKARNGR